MVRNSWKVQEIENKQFKSSYTNLVLITHIADKMLKKNRQSSHFIDKLHKGFVITCIAATIYGLAVAGHRGYQYLTVTKPAREAEELRRLKIEETTKDRETLTG